MAETNKMEQMLKALEAVFAPSETTKVKGEPEYVLVVNGKTIPTRIKNKEELDKTLRSMALEDVRTGRKTKAIVYKLEGEASVEFPSNVTVGTTVAEETTTQADPTE